MNNTRIFKMSFASVYPHYLQKAEKKGRTKAEVDAIIFWLTGTMSKHCKNTSIGRLILKPFSPRHPELIRMFQKLLV